MADPRKKTFHYKRARSEQQASLQASLKAALRRHPLIGDRVEDLAKTGQTRFVTLYRERDGMLFGVIVSYTQGNNQPVVGIDLAQKELLLEQIAPPPSVPGLRNEFVEGTLYFGIRSNHVVVLQSAAFRSGQFRDHINWLLQLGVPEDSKPPLVEVFDVPPPDVGIQATRGVKALSIHVPVEFEERPAEAPQRSQAKEVVVKAKGKGIELLRKLVELFGPSSSMGFNFNEALQTGDVELVVQVRYKKPWSSDKTVLDSLAEKFSHVDDEHFRMDLSIPGIGTVGTDSLRINEELVVETIKGLPDPRSVFPKMRDWLERLVQSNTVSG